MTLALINKNKFKQQDMKQLRIIALFILAVYGVSCTQDEGVVEQKLPQVADYDYKIMNTWNEAFLKIERYADGYRPGPAPRGIAYLGLAAYEACVSGMPEYKSFSGQWPGFEVPAADPNLEYNWPLVVNETYHYLLPLFFSQATQQELDKIDQIYNSNLKLLQDKSKEEVNVRSIARGRQVAEIVWNWAKTDAIGHEHYLHNTEGWDWQAHFKKDGDWKPTPPDFSLPVGGIWGQARTFSLKSDAERLCPPPLPFSEATNSELYAEALETYSQNTPTISFEKEWVAEFWHDDFVNVTFSPAVRWVSIGMQVFEKENSNLQTAIVTIAKMGMAMNDASVAAWYSKFYYNVERPVTYIKRVIDPNWQPHLYNAITGEKGLTPPFPSYPSGHGTMGSSAAEILASVFGYNYPMTDRSHEFRTDFAGEPRSYSSFFSMNLENAWSRVPLGVHFRMDSEAATNLGTGIGRKVNSLPWKK